MAMRPSELASCTIAATSAVLVGLEAIDETNDLSILSTSIGNRLT